jgi:hypothetical protein
MLIEGTAEDNMNVQLKDITVTARDGRVAHLEQVYIRGSHVRYFIVPDMLRYAAYPYNAHAGILTVIGMRPCSGLEVQEEEVLVWLVVGRLLSERGEPEEVVKLCTGDRRLLIAENREPGILCTA